MRPLEKTKSVLERHSGWIILGVSSLASFSIRGFVPMPMFSAYGILTATMIFMAAAAALLVLPSLLMLVAPGRRSP